MAKSPILGGFSTSRSPNASDNDAINLQVEIIETKDGNKGVGFLFGSSGLDIIGSVGSGPIRGLLPLNDVLYLVSGKEVYSLTVTGVATLLGQIGDQKSLVSMFQNTKQLMIVDGVGAWLVPGGFPVTGGTIAGATATTNAAGGLYALNDMITLLAATGKQNAYPIIKVTSITDNPVTSFTLPNAGTSYGTATNVATTNFQPQTGAGTGLTINVTASAGPITSITIGAPGVGYAVNDTGIITVGSQDAVYRVTAVSLGLVTGLIIINPGTNYATVSGAATAAESGDMPVNVGAGFTVDITAAGPITASSLHTGGRGYVVGATGGISGGSADATYIVHSIGPVGSVTGFSIVQGGAIQDKALSFTQKSTSGSGSGFTLTAPTYGAFVGLVPITMPFPNPLKGDISDGFGLLVFIGRQELAASDEEDLSTWQPLSFGLANQSPDNCQSLMVMYNEAFVFKSDNTEVWVDQGLPNFAFAPLTSAHLSFGIAAPFSVARADEELIWLSRNDQGKGIFVKAAAYKLEDISTQALVAELDKYANIGDCIAYARQEGGHVYYVATFPEANVTWCYDKTASKMVGFPVWTKLAAFDNGDLNRHWGNCFTPWTGSVQLIVTPHDFQAQSVTIASPTALQTATGLVGMPTAFSAGVFSVWLDIPDSTGAGFYFSNQSDDTLASTNPGLSVKAQNDTLGTPQITITAYDASNAIIVSATYDFTTWAGWVNLLVSFDTATQQIQVWANTLVSSVLVETELTAVSVTWSSSNPVSAVATQPWHVALI